MNGKLYEKPKQHSQMGLSWVQLGPNYAQLGPNWAPFWNAAWEIEASALWSIMSGIPLLRNGRALLPKM